MIPLKPRPAWLVLLVALLPPLSSGIEYRTEFHVNYEIEKKPGDKYYTGRIADDDLMDMYQKWIDTGLSSLMSAMAHKRLKRHRRSVANEFGRCSSAATDIVKHARCLSQLMHNKMGAAKKRPAAKSRLDRYQKRPAGFVTEPDRLGPKDAFLVEEDVHARRKRAFQVRKTTRYGLENKPQLSPMGRVARMLAESVKSLRNKTELPHWRRTVAKLRENGAKRIEYKKRVEEDSEESLGQMAMRSLRDQLGPRKPTVEDVDVAELVEDKAKLAKFLKSERGKKDETKVVDVIRQAMKLAYGLSGQNTTDFERRNIKLVSPRFLGVTKEEKKEDEISLVSPSLFSLHNEGEGIENLTSIPNLLRGMGAESDLWLDLVMEAAGVNEESDKLEDQVREFEYNKTVNVMMNISRLVDEDGTPMYATKDNATDLGFDKDYIEMFEKLHSNYSEEQLRDLNTTGYAVLSAAQRRLLYGPEGGLREAAGAGRLADLSAAQVHAALEETVHGLAARGRAPHWRARDVVLSPILSSSAAVAAPALLSQAFILSPVVLTPIILSPSVFGAIVLTPWLFVPVILAPRILGTLILSPFVFSPLVLSPFALHPAILSPGLFNPIILSPLLLLPLILSPQVFTPLILSPLCLSPIILNPLLGSPLILSPFVLSPLVGSAQILGGLVLSPYALSPVIGSPLIAFLAILSPSWLS